MQTQISTKLLQSHLISFTQLLNHYYPNSQQFSSPNSTTKKFYHPTTQSLLILFKTVIYSLLTLLEFTFSSMMTTKLSMLTNSTKILTLNLKDFKFTTLSQKIKFTNLFFKYKTITNSTLLSLLIFLNNNSTKPLEYLHSKNIKKILINSSKYSSKFINTNS